MSRFNPGAEPGFDIAAVDPEIVTLLRRAAEEYDAGLEPSQTGRYLVVLMTPAVSEYYQFGREEPALRLFDGTEWTGDVSSLYEAEQQVAESLGHRAELVEHHEGGLWYWTAATGDRALQPA